MYIFVVPVLMYLVLEVLQDNIVFYNPVTLLAVNLWKQFTMFIKYIDLFNDIMSRCFATVKVTFVKKYHCKQISWDMYSP